MHRESGRETGLHNVHLKEARKDCRALGQFAMNHSRNGAISYKQDEWRNRVAALGCRFADEDWRLHLSGHLMPSDLLQQWQ